MTVSCSSESCLGIQCTHQSWIKIIAQPQEVMCILTDVGGNDTRFLTSKGSNLFNLILREPALEILTWEDLAHLSGKVLGVFDGPDIDHGAITQCHAGIIYHGKTEKLAQDAYRTVNLLFL